MQRILTQTEVEQALDSPLISVEERKEILTTVKFLNIFNVDLEGIVLSGKVLNIELIFKAMLFISISKNPEHWSRNVLDRVLVLSSQYTHSNIATSMYTLINGENYQLLSENLRDLHRPLLHALQCVDSKIGDRVVVHTVISDGTTFDMGIDEIELFNLEPQIRELFSYVGTRYYLKQDHEGKYNIEDGVLTYNE